MNTEEHAATPSEPIDAPEPRRPLLASRKLRGPRVPDNLAFKLMIPLGFLFCAAVLIYVMSGLGDPKFPLNRVISRYAPVVIGGLILLLVVDGILAMVIDRKRTLLAIQQQAHE